MSGTRRKDADWQIPTDEALSWPAAQTAVLMDIRDELKKLNRLLYCDNFISIPSILRAVRANTSKPRPRLKPKKGRAR